ncbi:carotenoid oxygenase family protein [Hirschia maritima]|uniref:carotenoid oxygenase family protein n=1 Tax=Hirschia maritima TaxID=1121961 RepID=UPI00036D83FD|nr:carotenoid oxygenase family protein [Hirschia maritima]
MAKLVNKVKSTLSENDHPYLNGAWTPNFEEYDADDMEVIGEIPADIDGIYVRNTENPVHDAIGKYHPFDGDGMLHMMKIENGKASYKNRFIRTRGFNAEQEAEESLWIGFTGNPKKSTRAGWGAHGHVKDSSSTDVVVHAGEILSTFWQCGEGYRLSAKDLDTLGLEKWVPYDGISAHPKVDLETGELLFFNYSKHAPYMHYGVVGADNKLKHYVPIDIPGLRLPHDMAFSKNFSVVNDFPLYWPEELLKMDRYVPIYYPDKKSRFGIIPRFGKTEDVKWFEADPTYVLHFTNCYEDGDEVVLDGYFQKKPWPAPLESMPDAYKIIGAGLDLHSLQPHLHRWRFNMDTGETQEERLCDEEYVEFGTINPQYYAQKNRYVYSALGEKGWFLFSGLVKHDLENRSVQKYMFGEQRYGSETPFIPRKDATSEDDGYLISFITDMKLNRSECVILDAKNIEAGPVCQIILPHRICSGTHAVWAQASELSSEA